VWREAGKERTDERWTLVYVPGERMIFFPKFSLALRKLKFCGAWTPSSSGRTKPVKAGAVIAVLAHVV
jgi:hypothetical protein